MSTCSFPQVSIQTPCCKRWYECPECHDERENHPQLVNTIVVSFVLPPTPAPQTRRKVATVRKIPFLHRVPRALEGEIGAVLSGAAFAATCTYDDRVCGCTRRKLYCLRCNDYILLQYIARRTAVVNYTAVVHSQRTRTSYSNAILKVVMPTRVVLTVTIPSALQRT